MVRRRLKKNLPGRRLVTAQCFTNALYVENENGLGTLNIQFGWHTQTWTHLHRHSHNNGRRAKGRHVNTSSLTMGVVHLFLSAFWLPPFSLSLFFLFFLLISLWIKHFTTALPFCQNTIFLLLFIVFLLQNMYRLFRTTTKIQYPIYMQFLLFNNNQFIRWILLEFLFLLIVPSPLSRMAYSPSGCWWGSGGWRARYK